MSRNVTKEHAVNSKPSALLNDHGIEGEIEYGQSAHGGYDISTDLGGFEVKRRASQFALLYHALEQDGCVGVLHRDDRHGWLVTFPTVVGNRRPSRRREGPEDWIHVEVGLPDHPKVGRLARRLKVDREHALAIVVRLLCWTARAKEDGHLNGTDPEDIAEVCRWEGAPEDLVSGLVGAGWLDREDGGLSSFTHRRNGREECSGPGNERRPKTSRSLPSWRTLRHAATRCRTLRGEERRGKGEEKPPFTPLAGGNPPTRFRNLTDENVVRKFDEARAALRSDPSNPKAQETFDKLAAEITRRGIR